MQRSLINRTVLTLALVGAISLLASACGGSSSSGSSAGSAPTASVAPAATTGGGGGSGTAVGVTLKDFSITVGSSSFKPGTYTFHVTNQGPSSHNLTVNGPGVNTQATPTFASGGRENLTVTLKAGSYELYCSVPGHKQAGMDTHITVS
jgi:plastocyanin